MKKVLVLSVGMPRAGTGWFYNLTQGLVIAAGGVPGQAVRSKYSLEKLLTEINCNIGTISPHRLLPVMIPLLREPNYVIKLHAGRRFLADVFTSFGWIKPTFIFRDPRDALLSAYEYGQRAIEKGFENDFAHITSIDDAIEFITPYVSIASQWISSNRTFVTRYEDLLLDFDSEVEKLVEFLNISLPGHTYLEVIKKYRPGRDDYDHKRMHFQEGKIGRYKQHLTDDQIQRCNDLFGDFLIQTGYEI